MPHHDTAWPAGTPCWVDYSAVDVDAAQAFFSDLLGWTFEEGNPEYGGYRSCLSDGRRVAGLMPRMEPQQPPAWTTYFATDDADATAAAITANGGTLVVEPMDVGPMGRMVIALDPQGNAFGLWQAGQHCGIEAYNQPGALVWNDLATADPAAAQQFYGAVFGYRFEEIPGAGGYATFATGEAPLGGLGGLQPGATPGWATCFAVASTDDAVAIAEKAGGTVVMAPEDTPYGRLGIVQDPWGAQLSFMQELPT